MKKDKNINGGSRIFMKKIFLPIITIIVLVVIILVIILLNIKNEKPLSKTEFALLIEKFNNVKNVRIEMISNDIVRNESIFKKDEYYVTIQKNNSFSYGWSNSETKERILYNPDSKIYVTMEYSEFEPSQLDNTEYQFKRI